MSETESPSLARDLCCRPSVFASTLNAADPWQYAGMGKRFGVIGRFQHYISADLACIPGEIRGREKKRRNNGTPPLAWRWKHYACRGIGIEKRSAGRKKFSRPA